MLVTVSYCLRVNQPSTATFQIAKEPNPLYTPIPIALELTQPGPSLSTSQCPPPSPTCLPMTAHPCPAWWMSIPRPHPPSQTSAAEPSNPFSRTAPPTSTPTAPEPSSSVTATPTAQATTLSGPTPTPSTRVPSHPPPMRTPPSTASPRSTRPPCPTSPTAGKVLTCSSTPTPAL